MRDFGATRIRRARRRSRLAPLVAVGDPRAGVPQGGELLLQPLDAKAALAELVGDRDRGQARVADLAEIGAQRTDAAIEIAAGSVARTGKRIGRRSEAVDMKVPVWI